MRCCIRLWLNWQMQDTTVQHLQDTTVHFTYILTWDLLVCNISLKTMYNSHKFIWLYCPCSTRLVCWDVARYGGMWGDCPCAGELGELGAPHMFYTQIPGIQEFTLSYKETNLWHIYAVPDMLVSSTNTISGPPATSAWSHRTAWYRPENIS